ARHLPSGRCSGGMSLRMRRNKTASCSKNWYTASLVAWSTYSPPSANSRMIASVVHKKQPSLEASNPADMLCASGGSSGVIAVRYDMNIYRQHLQTRSRIGVDLVKFITMVFSTGRTSWQYLTAGFSAPGPTYGCTF